MRQHYALSGGAIALALACAGPVAAQSWQTRGSEAFVQNQARKSALVIECVQGRSVWLRIRNPTPWRADQSVSVQAGGRAFQMEIDGGADYVVLSDAPGIGISDDLIAALKGGGTLTLQGPATQRMASADRTYSLAGAATAIAGVERACGRTPAAAADNGSTLIASPGASPSPAPRQAGSVPPEVTKARAEIRKECGETTFKPGFQKTADFNGDGIPDYILDYTEIECGEAANMFCGSAGCTLDIFVSSGARYTHGYGSNVQAWSLAQANGKAVLVLGLHGSACGRAGFEGCNRRLVWNGGKFAPSR